LLRTRISTTASFDRSYLTRKDLWSPDGARESVECYDITKMISKRIEFVDSRTEPLVQAVDVYASFLRRLLSSETGGDDISHILGRLLIYRKPEGASHPQSLRVLTVSRKPSKMTGLFKTLEIMTSAARCMIRERHRLVA
jgi:Protein of unknown function (DUF3800)